MSDQHAHHTISEQMAEPTRLEHTHARTYAAQLPMPGTERKNNWRNGFSVSQIYWHFVSVCISNARSHARAYSVFALHFNSNRRRLVTQPTRCSSSSRARCVSVSRRSRPMRRNVLISKIPTKHVLITRITPSRRAHAIHPRHTVPHDQAYMHASFRTAVRLCTRNHLPQRGDLHNASVEFIICRTTSYSSLSSSVFCAGTRARTSNGAWRAASSSSACKCAPECGNLFIFQRNVSARRSSQHAGKYDCIIVRSRSCTCTINLCCSC